ncbi:MAG: S-layer homology domain-containing protein [Anaerovibrio sp.]
MNKKILSAAVAMALAAGISGTAMAAEGSLADVPKDHWSYQAVDQLVKDGIIEGMPDGTYAGDRAISRYEMAVIVARATDKMEAANIADRALIEKMQAEYGSELKTLQADVQDLKNQVGKVKFSGMFRATYDNDKGRDAADQVARCNDRFYMDIHADYKVNEHWTAKFQSETNHKYSEGHSNNVTNPWDGDSTDGTIQRIWAEGNFNNGSWVNIGRTWRGLGFTNTLQGGETDGVQAGIPIKGTGLTASAFYWAGTGLDNKQAFYGIGTWGSVGHAVDINAAYEKAKIGKGENTSNNGSVNAPAAYDSAFVLGAKVKLLKNVTLTGDYIQSNAENDNKAHEVRLDYKGTNLQDPGSFGVYARYFSFAPNAGNPDDEWGSRPNGNKGWMVGFKYVPSTNVEWHTMYSQQKKDFTNDAANFDRKLFRTEVDFHF